MHLSSSSSSSTWSKWPAICAIHGSHMAGKYYIQRVHCGDVIMSVMASEITSISIVCSTVCWGANKKKSKLCVTGLCEGNPLVMVDSPHKDPVMQKMFPFDDAKWNPLNAPLLPIQQAQSHVIYIRLRLRQILFNMNRNKYHIHQPDIDLFHTIPLANQPILRVPSCCVPAWSSRSLRLAGPVDCCPLPR